MLCKKLNTFLQEAKAVNYKQRTIYVRQFKEFKPPKDTDKNNWISEFNGKLITSLTNYTHGFYAGQELRDGPFRLKLQLMLPVQLDIDTFAENADGVFNTKDDRRVYHCLEQNLYDPQTVGWFLRSNWHMAASKDLQEAVEKAVRTKVSSANIGLSFKTVAPPTKQKYDKETAVRAIVISTNSIHVPAVCRILFQVYNSKNTNYPLDIPLHFVPHKDNPDVKSNPVAALNITTLMERQKIFLSNTKTFQCEALADIDREAKNNQSLKKILTSLTSIKGSQEGETPKAKLFHAVTTRTTKNGEYMVYLTFHIMLETEARCIIDNMAAFLRDELELDPDLYCHPIHIHEDHIWDPKTRICNNPTVSYLDLLVAKTGGLIEEAPLEDTSMTSKEQREYHRTVGIDDTETVKDLNKKRSSKTPSKPPIEVDRDDRSCRTEMSALTLYSSESKASQHRKQLRAEITTKDIQLEEKEAALAEAMKQIEALKKQNQKSPHVENQEEDEEQSTQSPEFLPKGTIDYPESDDERTVYVDDQEMFPLDNPCGHATWEPESNWIRRAMGSKEEVIAEAIKLHSQGYVIIISRTGATDNNLALYTEGDDRIHETEEADQFQECYDEINEENEKNDQGDIHMEENEESGVTFEKFKEVQYYQTDSNGIQGKNEEQSLDGKDDSPSKSRQVGTIDTDSQDSSSDNEEQTSSYEASDSSGNSSSTSAEKSSSQSSGVSTSSNEQPSKDLDISYTSPVKDSSKRKPNLTESKLQHTKEVVERVLAQQASGGDPGSQD